ncbi:hypothetical protein BKD26_07125 [Streptomyces sp. CB03238]|nr:hypothetical protein BKD26_07125 [Streptomyces sp. CB03238]
MDVDVEEFREDWGGQLPREGDQRCTSGGDGAEAVASHQQAVAGGAEGPAGICPGESQASMMGQVVSAMSWQPEL